MTQAQQPKALRFTKKPVTITASQWFKSGDHPAVRDISDSDDLFFTGMNGATLIEREKFGVIGTLESPNHLVTPGDWIITGVRGEHYPCKPDIFEETYAPETAPVALPKPVGWFHRHPEECKSGEVCNYRIASADKKYGWKEFPLYTEQQVHALLTGVPTPAAYADTKDAARYRWLRDNDWRNDEKMEPVIRLHLNAIWDEKIDAAMAAQARNKKGIEQ